MAHSNFYLTSFIYHEIKERVEAQNESTIYFKKSVAEKDNHVLGLLNLEANIFNDGFFFLYSTKNL